MFIRSCFFVTCALLVACTQPSSSQLNTFVNTSGNTIRLRFLMPPGYKPLPADGFGAYLRNLPLQPQGAAVHLYNGRLKNRQDIHAAVVKMDVGGQDLQQCADAVIRLRAEYLFHSRQYDKIHFNFTNGFRADYSRWRKGERIKVSRNNVSWTNTADPDTSYRSFRDYLVQVFSYAGTLSLSKELVSVPFKDMQPGDVLIQGGSPGHAVIVIDVATDSKGDKLFMLAQSYMPAQEIHVLVNRNNRSISPWYSMNDIGQEVATPEWDFSTADLKRFRE